jgi:hypothetical protein
MAKETKIDLIKPDKIKNQEGSLDPERSKGKKQFDLWDGRVGTP